MTCPLRAAIVPPKFWTRLAPRKTLRTTVAPQTDWFAADSLRRFYEGVYTVSEESNRMGLRLQGAALEAPHQGQMTSEGVSLGAIQIPASGQPIILFVEQQTTGGYPKIANIISADLSSVGQLRPRDQIRFEHVGPEEARRLIRAQERLLRSGVLVFVMHIDLNCDMGEIPAQIADGTQETLMRSITSVNIACGGHAGNEQTMKTTIEQALRWNLTIGAHPGYPDRANFGRLELDLPLSEIESTVFSPSSRTLGHRRGFATSIVHVKPHGALYNQAVNRPDQARAIARGVARFSKDVVLVGLAGSPMVEEFRAAGFKVAAEAFADRRYEPDGTLRSRKFDDALIRDPRKAAEQALRIARKQGVIASDGSIVKVDAQTICIHGDTPGAPKIAETVASMLQSGGISLRPLSPAQGDRI